MDDIVSAGIDTVIGHQFTTFFSTLTFQQPANFQNQAGTGLNLQGATILGYVGGALAFFLSIAGVYTGGSHLISELETSFFAFLEDFQDEDGYMPLVDDPELEKSKQVSDFLNVTAWDTLVLMLALFFHFTVLLGTGWTVAFMIINNIKTLWDTDNSNSTGAIDIDKGWKMLLLGTVFGGINYIAGHGVSYMKTTMLEMVGFHAHEVTKNTVNATSVTTPSQGTITTTITQAKTYERKKDIFGLVEILEEWPMLFWSQKFMQLVLPYAYLGMLDTIVSMAFFYVVFYMES